MINLRQSASRGHSNVHLQRGRSVSGTGKTRISWFPRAGLTTRLHAASGPSQWTRAQKQRTRTNQYKIYFPILKHQKSIQDERQTGNADTGAWCSLRGRGCPKWGCQEHWQGSRGPSILAWDAPSRFCPRAWQEALPQLQNHWGEAISTLNDTYRQDTKKSIQMQLAKIAQNPSLSLLILLFVLFLGVLKVKWQHPEIRWLELSQQILWKALLPCILPKEWFPGRRLQWWAPHKASSWGSLRL